MRNAFQLQLDAVLDDLVTLSRLVQRAVSRATQALLEADAEAAEQVIEGDDRIDELRERIEEASFELMALQQPVAGDLRTVVAALRMAAVLERSGDLSVNVARTAQLRLPDLAVPEEVLPVMRRMAEVASDMVEQSTKVIADRDVDAAHRLEEADDEMDELRKQTFRVLLGDGWQHGVEPAIDVALVGRYYERIGDHAVSIARRVIYLVTGNQ